MKKRLFLTAGFLIIIVSIGFLRGSIPLKDAYTIYSQTGHSSIKPPFSFHDVTKTTLPSTGIESLNDVKAQTYAAVGDFNNDGFEDLVYMYNTRKDNGESFFQVFQNTGKGTFIDVTDKLGFPKEVSRNKKLAAVAFIDVNNDGWEDLFVSISTRVPVLFINNHGKFSKFEAAFSPDFNGGDVKQISVFDFNNDGYLDIYLTRYNGPAGSYFKSADLWSWSPNDADDGGDNQILINNKDNSFYPIPGSLGANDSGYTWATGISDFNNDGFPDIFNANDFGFDKFYINKSGKNFVKSTEGMGSYRSHNSMSAETGDYNNDGLMDIYASNNTKAGMTGGFNSLWTNKGVRNDTLIMQNTAEDLGVSSCGWSWGSKFVDLDKDGWLDLIVVNGRHDAPNKSNWFLIHSAITIPYIFKRIGLSGMEHSLNASLANQQRNCVYWNQEGKNFTDTALDVGMNDLREGRSIVSTDIDNDGNEDFFITNLGSGPILYKTERMNKNSWLGIKLAGTKMNKYAIGAKVKLLIGDKKIQTREVYPTNGFFSQSSRRIVFGIAESDVNQPLKLVVNWPSGKSSEINVTKLNSYQTIAEPQ